MESSSGSSRPTAGRDLDLVNFLFRFLGLTFHQKVPKLLLNKNYVVWWIRHWTAKLYEQQQKFSLRK
jgi:hypothetical protein